MQKMHMAAFSPRLFLNNLASLLIVVKVVTGDLSSNDVGIEECGFGTSVSFLDYVTREIGERSTVMLAYFQVHFCRPSV